MKKIVSLIMALALCLTLFGCQKADEATKGISVVCASFAEYDWVKNLTANTDARVTLLADNGADMHSYQPTAADVLSIGKADLVVYNGGTADEWMTAAIKNSGFSATAVRIMDAVGKNLIHIGHHEDEDAAHVHGDYDEHVWLSLNNAVTACGVIAQKLMEADPDNKPTYMANLTEYTASLMTLNNKYKTLFGEMQNKMVVIADRFPFLYMMNDYGIAYNAAYEGCSAETEAGFEKVLSLAKTVDEQGISTIFIMEGGTDKLAKSVISNTKSQNQSIVTLDSMQSVTKKDIESGKSYLSVMTKNLEALENALK